MGGFRGRCACEAMEKAEENDKLHDEGQVKG